jgi:hypothetical protein
MDKVISQELFEGYLQSCFDLARQEIQDDPGSQLVPKLMIVVQDEETGGLHGELAIFEEFGENRYDLLRYLGADYGMKKELVVAVYLMVETWYSIQSVEQYEGHVENRVRPSEDPDRQEALTVTGMTLDQAVSGSAVCINAFIERDRAGRSVLQESTRMDGARNNLLMSFFLSYATEFLLRVKKSS